MEFLTLGPFKALHNGAYVELGERQQRLALAVLLLHANRPMTPDRMIDIMWPGSKPKSNLITGYIAGLRKIFKDAEATDVTIETTPTGYVLRIDEEQLDSSRFIRLYDQATAAARRGDKTGALTLLREAFDLWRGEHFEDLDIDRIGGVEAILLDEKYRDFVSDLAELELAAGNHRWVRDRLRPIVSADPSRERHVALLMRALLANGDQVEAMRIYYRTSEALAEFGMKPSADLRHLAWLANHGASSDTLPRRPAQFTGRAQELAKIDFIAASSADEAHTIWLSGTPGVGKTGLAVEAAHRLAKLFTDARVFISLNGFTPNVEPTAPVDALARALLELGVPAEQIPPGENRRKSLYQAKLVGTRTLIVLDNAASEDQVLPLLPEAPGCLAIVTSRKVGGLAASTSIRLMPLPPADAAELFRGLTSSARSSGRSAQVNEVVNRCGRLPLHIRMVASQFRKHDGWPLDYLVTLLNEPGPWPSDNEGAVACLVSYRQLNDSQRTIFRLFGQLPGRDLAVSGVAALVGCDVAQARSLLDGLHEACLLEENAPERYQMLDPIKEFAASVLESAGQDERPAALERLLDYYLVSVASAIGTAFPFGGDNPPRVDRTCTVAVDFATESAALSWLSTERPNLVAAIKYASESLPDHAWRMAVLLWRYFSTTGELGDWVETLELAKKIVIADRTNKYGQAHVLLRLAAAHRRSGRLIHAQELAAQALPRWVALGDIRGEANTLCALAMSKMELGDNHQAIADFEAALVKYEQVEDKRGQANVLSHLGHLNEQHGQLDLALRQHLAAVPMLRAIGHRQSLAHALDNLGTVQQRLGLLDEAMASHEEANRFGIDSGDRTAQAYALNNIGNIHRLRGQLDEAMHYHEDAKTAANGIPDAHLRTQLYLDRGATFQALNDQRAALAAYLAALDLAAGAGERSHQAHAHRGIADILHATGQHAAAVEHWEAAEAKFSQLHQPEALEIRRIREVLRCPCEPSSSR